MHHELFNAVTALADRLVNHAALDDGLRDDLRALAGVLLMSTERPPQTWTPGTEPQSYDQARPYESVPEAVMVLEAGAALVAPTSDVPTVQVAEVADLLEGKCVVLIGGSPRQEEQKAMRSAFRLKALKWLGTPDHGSLPDFEEHVKPRRVALVLLSAGVRSQCTGYVERFCREYRKPLVKLAEEYGINQVAAQILEQIGGRR